MDINDAWKATCKVLLGGEVGPLSSFEEYLSKDTVQLYSRKSCLSGRPVTVSMPQLPASARYISMDEMASASLPPAKPLSINQIKDIDSLVQALGERAVYCGNVISGNSMAVSESDSCSNVHQIRCCTQVHDSKFIACSSMVRYSEFAFGSTQDAMSKYIVRAHETQRLTRCFEVLRTYICTDCVYVANLENCSDCLFSFNQRSRRLLIGNLALEKSRYLELKKKLLDDIAQTLRSGRAVPSIAELIRDGDGS